MDTKDKGAGHDGWLTMARVATWLAPVAGAAAIVAAWAGVLPVSMADGAMIAGGIAFAVALGAVAMSKWLGA